MKKGLSKAVSFCMMIGLLAQSLYIPAMAEEAATEIAAESDTDTSLVGTLAFAQCEEYINIRESASTDSAVTAKIYNNGSATIEEQDGDWYKIRSGNAEGYVKAEYFVTGEAADAVAQKAAYNVAMVHPTDLNIRSDANEDSEVLATAHEKDELEVVAWDGDWMKVALGGDVYGYVNAYYVDYKTYYPTAETIEEEQAAAAKAAAEAAKSAQVSSAGTVQNSAVSASVDDVTLLAALIQCEAGNECYEGQLAVGAVVMNRVRSGRYAGSIYGVIYQAGQFPPAGRGAVASIAANGPKSSCIQAAQEALNGADNTGGATCFSRASSGHAGVVIGNHVFY